MLHQQGPIFSLHYQVNNNSKFITKKLVNYLVSSINFVIFDRFKFLDMKQPKRNKSRLKKADGIAIAIFAKLTVIFLLLAMFAVPPMRGNQHKPNFYTLKPVVINFLKHYSGFN
jgi:hypothetical protein